MLDQVNPPSTGLDRGYANLHGRCANPNVNGATDYPQLSVVEGRCQEHIADDQHDNLISLLSKRAQSNPQRGFTFYEKGRIKESPRSIRYPEFLTLIADAASQIYQLDVKPGSIFLLHFNNHFDNLLYFWAVTYAGYIPAMSTPFSNNLDQRRADIIHLFNLLENPVCLTRQSLLSEFSCQSALRPYIVEGLPASIEGVIVRECKFSPPINQGRFKRKEDVAALMLTSGSTGSSKAVCLTHGLILKSISSKCSTLQTSTQTPFFNWIGADHVACLTEMHGHALWAGADQVYAQATDIVANPLAFLEIVLKHRIAHGFAPNFFLSSLSRALHTPEGLALRKTMNLSCLQTIVTGGEANVVETCLALSELLSSHGAPKNCLKPAFGMTETSGGSIYNKLFPSHDVQQGYEFASVGKPIEGLEMRVTDDDGKELPHGSTGSLQVRGPTVFARYLNNPEATLEAFHNGWFLTGDQGMIDAAGHLSLTGRAKELLIINGLNYSPHAIEASLESIEGAIPSYTLVFPYRTKGSDTEGLCVVYNPTYSQDDVEARVSANNAISSAVLLQVGVRPLIIPLNDKILQKSTLGKLPRNKIRKAFDRGEYNTLRKLNEDQVVSHRAMHFEAPSTALEQYIIDTFVDVLGLEGVQLGATTNLFAMGINSINIITIKQRLQKYLVKDIPTITVISNPTARELAEALKAINGHREYNPVVVLQGAGSKAPLWLIHPGVGEVLVFLALASHFKDRPVYAMRARGFEVDEVYFENFDETVSTYIDWIRRKQPNGPYAIAGYSFGSIIAFEVTKILQRTDEIRFLGIFNLPPHIKFRMRQLDWTNCLLHLCYFLNFFSEDYAHQMHPILQQQSRENALKHVLDIAPRDRMEELGLDDKKLSNWVDLANSLQSSAIDYEPSGEVECLDIFAAVPLAAVAKDMDDWINNHLSKWRDFSKTPPQYHRVDGAHYTMISPAHVHTFQKTLKAVLQQRGI